VAYEALHDHLYLHVYLLVTVGSPLACRRESRRWFPVPATESDVSRGGSQACSAPRRGALNAGRSGPVAAKAAAIDAAQARPLTWKTVVKRALAVAVAGGALYLVLPKLIAVLTVPT